MGRAKAVKSKNKEKHTKRWLWGLSSLYLFGYYFLMRETQVCEPAVNVVNRVHLFLGFWDQYFTCRTINELGDALAGAFAPVAFIWLAGAVQIQSQELAAQREELSETRDVMREQLEVARAQVQETRASTELFRKQTDISVREHQLREEAVADAAVESAIELLPQQYLQFVIAIYRQKIFSDQQDDEEIFLYPFRLVDKNDHLNAKSVAKFIETSIEFRDQNNLRLGSWARDKDKILRLVKILEDIMVMAETASLVMRHKVRVLQLADAKSELESLFKFCDSVDKKYRLHAVAEALMGGG